MFKKRNAVYVKTIASNLKNNKEIKLSSKCVLDLASSIVGKTNQSAGATIPNIDNSKVYSPQGVTYYKGKIYAPYTKIKGNVSIIFVFSYNSKKKVLVGDGNLSFRITSQKFPNLFEIESCAIGKDGKLYFNCNTDKEPDKIAHFKKYKS